MIHGEHEKRSFEGRVAFVTGAASGIGRAAALAFARAGAHVVAVDMDRTGNEDTARQVQELGRRALALRCDVTRGEDVEKAVEEAVGALGRLDFAFNNAGVEPRKLVPIAEVEEAEWDRIMDVDLRGVFLCMKHEIPRMLAQGGGVIVNTSSGAGVIGIRNNAAYAAAKHAVIGLTRSSALEYAARNVRINAVCPGYIDTPMIERFAGRSAEARARVIAEEPIGRMGTPEEIAATVVWMCSDAAAFMVGHALVVDGGQTIA
jgi:NAD(P)-dependent dehydrogenase (short-subunit alcohol dehydrogenase family)